MRRPNKTPFERAAFFPPKETGDGPEIMRQDRA